MEYLCVHSDTSLGQTHRHFVLISAAWLPTLRPHLRLHSFPSRTCHLPTFPLPIKKWDLFVLCTVSLTDLPIFFRSNFFQRVHQSERFSSRAPGVIAGSHSTHKWFNSVPREWMLTWQWRDWLDAISSATSSSSPPPVVIPAMFSPLGDQSKGKLDHRPLTLEKAFGPQLSVGWTVKDRLVCKTK